ncbi:hypothetical protein [Smaragdicoccus niigatensis]|uniref:hypothetical protein n=1 Tax=Smaragdicoccus niigatensis TaxID=359359 RepID=UPI00035F1EEB|nr:hypothetical protein [Smaragdicoccus niigatensis]
MTVEYSEQQTLSPWIKILVVVPVVTFLSITVMALINKQWAAAVVIGAAVLVLAGLAAVQISLRLTTTVDESAVRLRIRPAGLSFLPRRMTTKDVPLSSIASRRIQTYNSLTDREFWGWKVWGLSHGRRGRILYGMRPEGLFKVTGVRIETTAGEVLLIGTADPDALLAALERRH